MLSYVVDSFRPGLKRGMAESTPRDKFASSLPPGGHDGMETVYVVGEFQVLAEVVFAREHALLGRSLAADAVIVGLFEVVFVSADFLAEDAHGRAVVVDESAVRGAPPLVHGQMQGLFVSLPVVLGREGVRAKGTLVGSTGFLEAVGVTDVSLPMTTARLGTVHGRGWARWRPVR